MTRGTRAMARSPLSEEVKAKLPDPLAAVARARLRAPAASLSELAARLGITKWVVRGRLRHILEVART